MTLKWLLKEFPDVHTRLGQFGRPVSFDFDLKATPVYDAIHWQPVEQLDKMKSKGKIKNKKIYKKLTLAKILCWTFRQLLLPSSAKDKKMQMSNSVLMVHDVC